MPASPLKHSAALTQQPYKGATGVRRILNATGYSWAGLCAAWRGEAAFRQLIALNALLIPLACYLNVSRAERALLIASALLCPLIELLNSAIEAAIDRISLERHALSKQAKDMGSAAQTFALLIVASTWAVILL